jgi:hypothetical protein
MSSLHSEVVMLHLVLTIHLIAVALGVMCFMLFASISCLIHSRFVPCNTLVVVLRSFERTEAPIAEDRDPSIVEVSLHLWTAVPVLNEGKIQMWSEDSLLILLDRFLQFSCR